MKTKQDKIKTPDNVKNMIRAMLANMAGEVDRTEEMVAPIEPSEFPHDMPFERDVLIAYYDLSKHQISPTRDNIIQALVTSLSYKDADAIAKTDALLQEVTEDRFVRSLSHFVAEQLLRNKIEDTFSKAYTEFMLPVGKVTERLNKAVEMIASAADDVEDSSTKVTMGRDDDKYWTTIARARKLARESGVVFPNLKYKGFVGEYDEHGNIVKDGAVPVLPWGETALISALQGTGKTTVGIDLAEHNAWHLGHDVLYLHLETGTADMMERSISKGTLIPMDYLLTRVDIDNSEDPITKRIKKHFAYTKLETKPTAIRSSGDLVYHYVPGWNVYKINAAVKLMRKRAQDRGRGLLVFVDYYNIIDYSAFGLNRAEALGHIAKLMRDNVKKENLKANPNGAGSVYMIMFSQETEEGGSTHTYGSKEIMHYVQLYISMKRVTADFDLLMGSPDGKIAKDALGNNRFWHRGGETSSEVQFHILKGNRSSKGIVNVKMEGKFFRMEG